MTPVFSVLFLGLWAYLLVRVYSNQKTSLRLYFWPGIIVKVLSGISLGLIYTYYYPIGDTFGFFADAQKIAALVSTNLYDYFDFLLFGDSTHSLSQDLINVQRRSLFLVKILSTITVLSFNSYWIAGIYFSIFSFLGSWYLIAKINFHYEKVILTSIISFLAIPSFLFWSSGIIKESLAVGALLFLAGAFLQLIKKQNLNWWEWLMCLITILVLWNLKYYWAALFVPSILTSLIVIRMIGPLIPKRLESILLLIWVLLFTSIVLAASTIHPNFYLSRFLTVIVENHDAYAVLTGDGPFINFSNLNPSWASVIVNSPWALLSCLYRPFLFEATTGFQILFSIENFILLLLSIYNLKYIARVWHSSDRLIIFGLIIYIAFLAIFLALSTPNFGTLSRYRVGFLPFLFFLLLYFPIIKISKSS